MCTSFLVPPQKPHKHQPPLFHRSKKLFLFALFFLCSCFLLVFFRVYVLYVCTRRAYLTLFPIYVIIKRSGDRYERNTCAAITTLFGFFSSFNFFSISMGYQQPEANNQQLIFSIPPIGSSFSFVFSIINIFSYAQQFITTKHEMRNNLWDEKFLVKLSIIIINIIKVCRFRSNNFTLSTFFSFFDEVDNGKPRLRLFTLTKHILQINFG